MADQSVMLRAGLNNVGSYQVSSIPYVTSTVAPPYGGTPVEISFPSVTKFVLVKNIDNGNHTLRVGFSANGVNGTNYLILSQDESFTADLKVTKIYLIGNQAHSITASIFAGLTGITADQLPNSWSGSAGVG